MFVHALQLTQFRNYTSQTIAITAPKLILVGDNAQGKSNFLEALQLLATGRSSRANRDRELIQQGAEQARIIAQIERREGTVELELILRATGQRTARLNGVTQPRVGSLIGQVNTVFFSSLDLDLVRGGPQERRAWIDGILVQLEPVYAQLSEHYQQVLHQRNALLKHHRLAPVPPDQLSLWDEQLARAGTRLIRRRRRLLERLAPLADHWQAVISGGNEHLTLHYRSRVPAPNDDPEQIEQAFLEQIAQKKPVELYQGASLVGPHRDEVEFLFGETPARLYGSQGQQRTLVLALKLAELHLIEQVIAQPPLLLLDDVLAELDLKRQNYLLNAIGERVQTFVTTTHLGAFEADWLKSACIWRVCKGTLQEDS
ncbi:DNA replication/repair protein RecF [Anthocerotibacter panamensis]|uniref:DNA replication/repair protein RecF n=1 Tax=Anthocerotibacter panamensis TaxID=2857077 RepID=UPI001C402F36|nr:DNA replication/repair protein RecF [Anthocerotibacter panamensis]